MIMLDRQDSNIHRLRSLKKMDHWLMLALLFIGSFLEEIRGININVVNIPSLVRDGTDEPIVLDCDYDMGRSSNKGLTIKWYIGQDLLYQWIHGKPPTASDEYHKYVDVSYRASDNPNTMYRAVKLVRPGLDLSGEYRCVVFTHDDEVEARGRMLVYSPEHHFTINHNVKDESAPELTVRCLAEGIYPQPKMTLQKMIQTNMEVILNQRHEYMRRDDGRFDAVVSAIMDTEKMQLPVTLKCELYIQEANYTAIREYVYSGSSRLPRLSIMPIVLAAFLTWCEK